VAACPPVGGHHVRHHPVQTGAGDRPGASRGDPWPARRRRLVRCCAHWARDPIPGDICQCRDLSVHSVVRRRHGGAVPQSQDCRRRGPGRRVPQSDVLHPAWHRHPRQSWPTQRRGADPAWSRRTTGRGRRAGRGCGQLRRQPGDAGGANGAAASGAAAAPGQPSRSQAAHGRRGTAAATAGAAQAGNPPAARRSVGAAATTATAPPPHTGPPARHARPLPGDEQ
jgi:hypothetical protein